MGQASLFSRAQIAAMRDRTMSRNYSAAREEFRREHERHRAWGLQRRHADKLRRVRQCRSAPAAESVQTQRTAPASPLQTPAGPRTATTSQMPADRRLASLPAPARSSAPSSSPAPIRHPRPAPLPPPTALTNDRQRTAQTGNPASRPTRLAARATPATHHRPIRADTRHHRKRREWHGPTTLQVGIGHRRNSVPIRRRGYSGYRRSKYRRFSAAGVFNGAARSAQGSRATPWLPNPAPARPDGAHCR